MDQLHKSGEDYLEAVLFIEQQKGRVKSIDVAKYLGVSRPSVNRALTNLQEMGYISKPIYGEVTITESGRKRAQAVAKKHTALTRLLSEVLGVSPSVAEKDACKIEHDISDETTDRLIEYLKKTEAKND